MDTPPVILSLITSGIYYAIIGVLSLLAIFSVYILLRYGKNKLLSLVVSAVFSIVYLSLLSQSYQTLQTLK